MNKPEQPESFMQASAKPIALVPPDDSGWIFNIQRYSIQDGPGVRTTVFFLGCPLSCLWCSNPESQAMKPQLSYMVSRCKQCQSCIPVCPTGAISVAPDGAIVTDRNQCNACGACVEVCPTEARSISGKMMSVDEVMTVIKKDSLFYRNSGGGVTASGGEPLTQPKFLLALFKACHRLGLHTCLDTTGFAPWPVIEPILAHTELISYDIKHMDPERHRELTGVGNKLILQNAERIVEKGIPLVIRVPLIPECNDSKENMDALAKFAVKLGVKKLNLIPYHKLGVSKYERFGMKYPLQNTPSFDKNQVDAIKMDLSSHGLEVTVI